jgi:hypothetical protein
LAQELAERFFERAAEPREDDAGAQPSGDRQCDAEDELDEADHHQDGQDGGHDDVDRREQVHRAGVHHGRFESDGIGGLLHALAVDERVGDRHDVPQKEREERGHRDAENVDGATGVSS